ncbi:hypothetical protein RND81_09G196600 [Saponaria officinalis]|uniref:Integrase catalytic domain-containing protein n=1 Tax=Saponaria officinalis TaxID=3572 RepID=A0AAW1IN33_SAPOF
MELVLSAKRRLGYVTGKIPKPKEDEDKIEAWIVNNNQVITWILQNVSERIKMVIIYTPTAKGVWDTLEKRYTVSNGARKYKLNKESYEAVQNGKSVEEYYTQLQVIWDELESMSSLPTLSKVTTEIAEYLTTVDKQAEERRLFQFLNGLDKQYGMLRSNMVMMDLLPTVEHTVSLVLQEKCNLTTCAIQNIKGYPVGHPKHRKATYKPGVRGGFTTGFKQQKSHQNNFRQQTYRKSAASAKAESTDLSAAIGAATQQLENLLKMVSGGNTNKTQGESEDELECNYAGMSNSYCQTIVNNDWIIDSGATNHMTAQLETLENVKELSVQVTHKGEIMLNNGLRLKGVLYFYEYANTQFDKKIKCRKYFEDHGIIHQTSIVDRPQQNGVVERKHKHILEISRVLRFHSGLPLSYWGDCVMTAAYLINRLPSFVIKNQTPYEVIHNKPANYNNLKVFGCLAMAYNPDRNKDKFQPRGVPCVFLGYPANQKGYKVEDLVSKKRFVTRDVKFYEHILPYAQGVKKKSASPEPLIITEDITEDIAENDRDLGAQIRGG